MPRPQFTLRALLVLVLAAGCFFGGMSLQRRLDAPTWLHQAPPEGNRPPLYSDTHYVEQIRLRDGSEWQRMIPADHR
jgi:hypothetical protein